jgi:ferredoxin-NADP reductase
MSTISKATVLAIKEYGEEIREYSLKLEKNHYFEAGSFLLLTLDVKEHYSRWPSESRCFSVASQHNELGVVKLIIRKVGAYTSQIFNQLGIGSECVVKYAFGDFLLPFFDKNATICCIAGGTGIAPILSFCEQLKRDKREQDLHVFYSFKDQKEIIGKEVLQVIVPDRQLHLFSTRQSLEGALNRRILPDDIICFSKDWKKSHFYICGNDEFTSYFRQFLEKEACGNIYTDEW